MGVCPGYICMGVAVALYINLLKFGIWVLTWD